MRENKKAILISWLIGIGFGMFFSGIILSVLLYASNRTKPLPIVEGQSTTQAQEANPDKDADLPKEEENVKLDEIRDESKQDIKEDIKVVEEKVEKIEVIKEEKKKEDPEIKKESSTIKLNIKTNATGHEITQMLVDNGVISDYDGFIRLIVLKDAERSLAHGVKVFPLNSDIETVFKILRP